VIDVVRDREGVRQAIEALLEEDLVRARIDRELPNAAPETRERMLGQIPPRRISPGYFRWAEHLLRLEAEREAGVGFSARDLAAFECDGLVALVRARAEFRNRHPPCSGCGTFQENRFSAQCCGCGVKFRRKGN
jgi:hypothetical protein